MCRTINCDRNKRVKMRGTLISVFMFCFCIGGLVKCVRILELRVPAHAAEGSQALLGCQFDMEDDLLYSVKWYKDKREFYRYVPRSKPPAASFYSPGISVDMSRSSSDVVTLVNLTQDSAGSYRCEVSGETPLFTTAYEEKYINIHLLPDSAPRITGLSDQYQIGDRVLLNCTSSASKPETQLKWLVNDQPAPRKHLQGPWYRVAADRADATETILQLRFTVTGKHFRDGNMKLKCQAMIAPMYQEESTQSLSQDGPNTQKPSVHKWDSLYQDPNRGHQGTQIVLPDKDDEDKYLDFIAALADAADRSEVSRIVVLMSIAFILEVF